MGRRPSCMKTGTPFPGGSWNSSSSDLLNRSAPSREISLTPRRKSASCRVRGGAILQPRPATLFTLHEATSPGIRCGIADRAEHLAALSGVKNAVAHGKAWLQRESGAVPEPRVMVLKGNGLSTARCLSKERAHANRRRAERDMDLDVIHLRALTRLGNPEAESDKPSSSLRGSATSARRSSRFSAWSTDA